MDLVAVWTAIKARADADNAAGGIGSASPSRLITGFFNRSAPDTGSMAYIVANEASCTPRHTFTGDVWEIVYRMAIYCPRTGTTPLSTLAAIEARLEGDSSGGGAPTYGFGRHKLVIASGSWTADYMMPIDKIINDDDEAYCHITQYRFHVWK